MAGRMRHRYWRWGGVLLLAFTLAFAALAWRRGAGTYDAGQVVNPCLEIPEGGEHRARAGCEGLSRVGDQEALLRFNSLGLRDREYPPKPARGVTRILVLGSSGTLGLGTPEADTFPRRLETELRARGLKAEVINGATVGYCTIQTAIRARELIARYAPSLVLYHLVIGTCPLFDGAWHGRVSLTQGYPAAIDRTPFPGGPSWLNQAIFSRPRLFFLWLTVADQLRKAAFSWRVAFAGGEEAKAAAVLAPSVVYLDHLKAESEGSGARFAIASYRMRSFAQPVPQQSSYPLTRLLAVFLMPWELDADSLFRALRGHGYDLHVPDFRKNQYLIPGDMHFTAEGYRDYAARLAEAKFFSGEGK